eukprot:GCRY01002326.1.p1 GENE.GCRY01002326.1~~GCRY01002326.1.p1  ORF type:complete len:338 (-),score=33.39 GCRY01002326.1:26-1039(-)
MSSYPMTPQWNAALKKDVHTYTAPWPVYSLSWTWRCDNPFRLAIGSFIEEYQNKVAVLEVDSETGNFRSRGEIEHLYPATKISFIPSRNLNYPDLFATCGDFIRIWAPQSEGVIKLHTVFTQHGKKEYCAPQTSFDWNETDPNLLASSSIDTTITIWDVETSSPRTQLIAHDKEVYDVCWNTGIDTFASVGSDGSVRMFDLRSLEHSTIIYESPDLAPLLRLSWNKMDNNYLATFMADSREAIILDIRVPSLPVAELSAHTACLNSCHWAPHSSCHVCTTADDSNALIWDLSNLPKSVEQPVFQYEANSEINNMAWTPAMPDWMAVAYGSNVQVLKV